MKRIKNAQCEDILTINLGEYAFKDEKNYRNHTLVCLLHNQWPSKVELNTWILETWWSPL